MANGFVAQLPVNFISLMATDGWHGGHLIDLPESEGVRTPTAKELSKHYIFLKAVVEEMPSKAWPSAKCLEY